MKQSVIELSSSVEAHLFKKHNQTFEKKTTGMFLSDSMHIQLLPVNLMPPMQLWSVEFPPSVRVCFEIIPSKKCQDRYHYLGLLEKGFLMRAVLYTHIIGANFGIYHFICKLPE